MDSVPLDPGDLLDEEERAALHRTLRESDLDVAEGPLSDANEVYERISGRGETAGVRFCAGSAATSKAWSPEPGAWFLVRRRRRPSKDGRRPRRSPLVFGGLFLSVLQLLVLVLGGVAKLRGAGLAGSL